MKNKIISFSSKFGKPEKFNSQFHMVKIYIAYTGKNRNGSVISKETFEKMLPSLYGVPVVGEWKSEKEDFGSHGGKVEISEDGIEFIDTTKPYGYIDSSATVQWEILTEEDGAEKEYLTTTAFLWTSRYPEALKVLDNKNGQSMEINVFDGKVFEEDEQYFEILDGEFSALCILGEQVEPCFESAKVSQFNLDKDSFKSEFTEMVAELKKSLNFSNQNQQTNMSEGVEGMADDKTIAEEVFEEEENVAQETESMFATYNQKREAIRNALDTEIIRDDNDKIIEETYYWVADFDDEYVYVERSHWKEGDYNSDYGRFTYSFSEESLEATVTGEFEKMILTWLTEEENKKVQDERNSFEVISNEHNSLKSEHLILQEKYNAIETEIEELKEFKTQKDKEDFEVEQQKIREEKINHINTEYENISEDIKELFINKIDEYEAIEDLDADICVYIVKNKVTFSRAKKENTSIKLEVEQNEQKLVMSPYGDLF